MKRDIDVNKKYSRKDFQIGQKLKIFYNIAKTAAGKKEKCYKGKVIQLTDSLVILQCKNYTTSLKYTDFAIGLARLEA